MKPLAPEQLDEIRRARGRERAPDLARRLGVSRKQVEAALEELGRERPPAGRAHPAWFAAAALAIVLCGVIAYSGNREYGFHYDDNHTIQQNEAIRTLRARVEQGARSDLSPLAQAGRVVKALPPTAEAIYDYNLYRMVTYWSFALTYYRHELELEGWHAANNRIHYLNGVLAFWVAYLAFTAPAFALGRRGVRRPLLAALLVGLVFELHPLQTQAVTYLAQRTESLCATFYLLSLGLYATARRRSLGPAAGRAPWMSPLALGAGAAVVVLGAVAALKLDALALGGFVRLALGVLVAVLAALVWLVRSGRDERWHAALTAGSFLAAGVAMQTKEIGATIPLAICLWELCFVPARALAPAAAGAPAAVAGPGPWTLRLRYLGPWAAVVVGVGVLLVVFGGANIARQMFEGIDQDGPAGGQLWAGTYAASQLNVLWTYVRLFLLPFGLHLDHDYPQVGRSTGATVTAVLSGLGLVALLGLLAWRGHRARVLAFALPFALVVLAPTSTVIVLPDLIYEHRFYLPLFGAALVLAAAADRLLELLPERHHVPALGGLLLVTAVVLTPAAYARNAVWESELTLWRDNVDKAPGKPRAWTNLGLAYQNLETADITLSNGEVVQGALSRLPDGSVLIQRTRTELLELPPERLAARAVVSEKPVGGPERAIEAYERALALDPAYTKALSNLSLCRIAQGHLLLGQARMCGQLAQQYAGQGRDGDPGARAMAQRCLDEAQRRASASRELFLSARDALLRIVELRPAEAVAHANLGGLNYRYLHDLQAAEHHYLLATRDRSAPPDVWVLLGEVLMLQADERWKEAVRVGQPPLEATRELYQRACGYYEEFLRRERRPERRQATETARRAKLACEATLEGRRDPTREQVPEQLRPR